ncbi:MAG: hypothetical protein LBM27_01365 [Lactobacillaceae bacterium]|nr:hypothetical protein [Lactobacillaceae bacterium]
MFLPFNGIFILLVFVSFKQPAAIFLVLGALLFVLLIDLTVWGFLISGMTAFKYSDDGITIYNLKKVYLSWKDIKDVELKRVGTQTFIYVYPVDTSLKKKAYSVALSTTQVNLSNEDIFLGFKTRMNDIHGKSMSSHT